MHRHSEKNEGVNMVGLEVGERAIEKKKAAEKIHNTPPSKEGAARGVSQNALGVATDKTDKRAVIQSTNEVLEIAPTLFLCLLSNLI
jgi:hypothetical protein